MSELRLEQARLAAQIATLKLRKAQKMEESDEELEDEEEQDEEEEQASSTRVEEWLKLMNEDTRPAPPPPRVERGPAGQDGRGQGDYEDHSRHRGKEEPRPARHDIAALAEAITMATRQASREAPKFLQELPLFNGQSNAWLPFKAAYEETARGFTATENIARIRRSLRGVALEAVQNLLLSNPEPAIIITTLERRFGRPEAIVMGEMEKIRSLQKISENPRDLLIFSNKIANIVATVEALKKIQYLHSPEMSRVVVEKLSPITRNKWYDYAARTKEDVPELKRLSTFLNEEADKCGAYASFENIHEERKRKPERTFHTHTHTPRCPACGDQHSLPECKKFQAAAVDQRWEIAKKSRICFRCLRSDHRRGNCKAKLCGHQGCPMAHHKMLHHEKPKKEDQRDQSPQREEVGSTYEEVKTANNNKRRAYLKIVPVVLSTSIGGEEIETFALLDEGSTITIVDEEIAQQLNIDGPTDPMWVRGISGTELKYQKSKRIDLKIRGKFENQSYDLRDARTVRNLNFTSQRVSRSDVDDCPHLQGIREELVYEEARPKLLIGQDNWELIISGAVRAGRRDMPVASSTKLGWVLHGCRSSASGYPVAYCGHLSVCEDEENSMEKMMKNYFELESIGIEKRKQNSDPEQRALRILHDTSRRLPDGRFETGLLWKEDNMKIPNNYENSLKRLHNLEKKLDRNEDLKTKYEERIQNLFTSGYAEEATTPPVPGKTWYLPHFAVVNPAKPKIRVVHDAAARTAGRSLNDMLLSGPDLLQSLPGVVMRFRQHPHAVSADIKEMFMQIRIQEQDRDALRFLWRGEKREGRPQEYRMTSVIFGATSSPCTALYVKNRNASDFIEEYPAAARAIRKSHYMDDYIASFATEQEAKEISRSVDYVHRQAGFELRGWVSNSKQTVQQFAADPGVATVAIGGSETEKTLGLLWDVTADCIGFKLNTYKTPQEVLDAERPPTKREALSIIMSLFDPLGLVSPITTPAKRIMQETWRYGTGWDDPLPDKLHDKWNEWLRTLRSIEKLRIPRCYDAEPACVRDLHTFVDASEEAYAAAVYWRIERADGSVQVALAVAKSRVTPLKPISIPRLELQAALLGARLADTTAREHEFEIRRKYYWSDSRTALAWIRSEPRAYKTFVAHRLAEIEDTTKKNEWRWLPTADNVADDATRSTPAGFSAAHRWYRGPHFLYLNEEDWPQESRTEPPKTGEERETCHVAHQRPDHTHLPDVERFSSYTRLLRATARTLQFVDLCKKKKETVLAAKRKRTKENKKKDVDWKITKKSDKKKQDITTNTKKNERKIIGIEAHYLIRAEKLWWKAVQEDAFHEDIQRVRSGAAPHHGDRLAALSVVIGEDGVLRLKGRIHASPDIDEETASPTVLDGKHRFTRLYIQHVHEKLHHGSVETVVNELRQRTWIMKIRPTVRDVIKSCQRCRIRRAKPTSPATGDLPPARVSHHARPFSFTGLDYFGPMEVTVGRHHEKRYVALFTCMTSRAVHLEVAASLSADSAICALRRFMARRGVPKELWSDNATCFKAAERELAEAALAAVSEEAKARHVAWRYIPPASPFMGGAWERMVRTVKEALRVTLLEQYPSDETLLTLLAEAENTVNSRPLTHVAVSPEEPEALTPNHILLGPNSHVPPPGDFTADDLTARKHWRRAQRLADVFWSRWVKEYQPLLQHRREPHTTGSPPAVGDLVLICDPNLPRNTWPRGRVIAVYPGRDGEVRIVDIETSIGHTLRRPTKKIVVLPIGSRNCDGGRNVHDEIATL